MSEILAPTQLFNEQLGKIGEKKAVVVMENFVAVENMFKSTPRHLNIDKLAMIVKVKNSSYRIKYTYNRQGRQLVADKLLDNAKERTIAPKSGLRANRSV